MKSGLKVLTSEELLNRVKSMRIWKIFIINKDLSIKIVDNIRDPSYMGICIYKEDGDIYGDLWIKVDDKYEYIEKYFRKIGEYYLHHSLRYILNISKEVMLKDVCD